MAATFYGTKNLSTVYTSSANEIMQPNQDEKKCDDRYRAAASLRRMGFPAPSWATLLPCHLSVPFLSLSFSLSLCLSLLLHQRWYWIDSCYQILAIVSNKNSTR